MEYNIFKVEKSVCHERIEKVYQDAEYTDEEFEDQELVLTVNEGCVNDPQCPDQHLERFFAHLNPRQKIWRTIKLKKTQFKICFKDCYLTTQEKMAIIFAAIQNMFGLSTQSMDRNMQYLYRGMEPIARVTFVGCKIKKIQKLYDKTGYELYQLRLKKLFDDIKK